MGTEDHERASPAPRRTGAPVEKIEQEAQAFRPNVRPMLIAVSGEYTKGADRLRAELSGFDYYLIKPCDPAVLLQLIASYNEQRALAT